MTLKQLKEELNKYYKFDITERNRQREYSYARKVYCRLARELKYTFQSLGTEIGISHDCALYHYKGFNVIGERDKKIFNKIITKYNLPILLCATKKKIKPIADTLKNEDPKTHKEELINELIDIVSKWEDNTLENFMNTRVKVYNKLIEITKQQKKIEEVKGATLNRPVKNPVLC